MDFSIIPTEVLSYTLPWTLPVGIGVLVITFIADIINRKFHYQKYGIVIFILSIVLLIIQLLITYQVLQEIIDNA